MERRPKELIAANLSVHAHQSEHIVNLLQVNFFNSDEDMDFIATLKTILMEKDIDFPEALDQDKLNRIHSRFEELLFKWNNLRKGETLELVFNQ